MYCPCPIGKRIFNVVSVPVSETVGQMNTIYCFVIKKGYMYVERSSPTRGENSSGIMYTV